MDIRAPKDGFVVDVKFDDGASVKRGELLLLFDSMDEDRQEEKITKMISMRKAYMSQYDGEQLKVSIQLLESAVSIAGQDVLAKQRRVDFDTLALQSIVGENPGGPANWSKENVLANSKDLLAMSQLKESRARDDLTKFNFSVERARTMAQVIEEYFSFELRQLQEKRLHLQVRSPIAGKLNLLCGLSSYAKHGTVIAWVNPL